jgi:hypothetical protein
MLLVPYVTGILATTWTDGALARISLGMMAILLLFMARAPLMYLAKRYYRRGNFGSDTRNYWISAWLYSLSGLSLFAVIVVIDGGLKLPLLALTALVLALAQSWLAVTQGERAMIAELTGVLLLTLTAPLGMLLAGNGTTTLQDAVILWAVNASFFAASIFNVKMKVASMVARRDSFTIADRIRIARDSLTYLALTIVTWLLLSISGLAPVFSTVAFVPLVAYIAWSLATMSSKLKIRMEGFIQLGMSIGFAVIVIVVWRIG